MAIGKTTVLSVLSFVDSFIALFFLNDFSDTLALQAIASLLLISRVSFDFFLERYR